MLAYPDYLLPFDICTAASSCQLGAVITQKGKPIAFYSPKLSETQHKYSVTEIELLSIVETLKSKWLEGVARVKATSKNDKDAAQVLKTMIKNLHDK